MPRDAGPYAKHLTKTQQGRLAEVAEAVGEVVGAWPSLV